MTDPNLVDIVDRLLQTADIAEETSTLQLSGNDAKNHAADIRLLVWAVLQRYRNDYK